MVLRKESFTVEQGAETVRSRFNQVVINNLMGTPVKVFLAKDEGKPSVKDAYEYTAPPKSLFSINSGWMKQARTTLIVRTGLDEASIIRLPHSAQLTVEAAPNGLKYSSNDGAADEPYTEPRAVPQIETEPMISKKETFAMADSMVAKRPSIAKPWATQVTIDNQCTNPLKFFVAHDAAAPSVKDSHEYV